MPNLNLPTPNKSPGDGAPADDINLVIDAVNTLNSAVDNIPAGPQGPQGEPGTPGAAGANASVSIGSVNTGAPGSSAAVTNSGTAQNAVFNFTIPQGATGAAGAAGAQGPQGPKGDTGDTGPVGPTGVVAANAPLSYDTLNRTINLAVEDLQLDPDQVTGLDPTGQTGKFVGTLDGSGLDWITSTATTSWGAIAGTLSDQTDLQTALNNKAPSTGIDPSAITGTAVVDSDARLTNERTPVDGSVTEAKIATGAVTEGKIGTGAVTETKIGTGAVTSDKIANGTIVDADISNTAAIAPSKINGTAVVDSDARLTDTRTPTDGTVTDAKITAGGLSPTAITGTAVVTNDSRLSDARTPLAHAASHGVGQSDAITVAQSQVTNLTTDLSAKAPLASPALSGTPTAPTAAVGTDTTQIATTAFVNAEISNDAILKSIVDAKGDIIAATADNTVARVAVGTDGQALIADSTQTSGVRWGTVATDPTPTALFLGGM